jgi:hypothetical protein
MCATSVEIAGGVEELFSDRSGGNSRNVFFELLKGGLGENLYGESFKFWDLIVVNRSEKDIIDRSELNLRSLEELTGKIPF